MTRRERRQLGRAAGVVLAVVVVAHAGQAAASGHHHPSAAATAAASSAPRGAAAVAIAYAHAQLGKPYAWAGTGPYAFDCSGLVMRAYQAGGVWGIPRTSQAQWAWGPQIPAGQEEPGDLVFFAGADGTMTSPGHVGVVIGHGLMIEAYATGYPIRIAPYGNRSDLVGFTRPWAHR